MPASIYVPVSPGLPWQQLSHASYVTSDSYSRFVSRPHVSASECAMERRCGHVTAQPLWKETSTCMNHWRHLATGRAYIYSSDHDVTDWDECRTKKSFSVITRVRCSNRSIFQSETSNALWTCRGQFKALRTPRSQGWALWTFRSSVLTRSNQQESILSALNHAESDSRPSNV